ncbi:hypothetical protein BB560_006508 [Smittium megazygosporum]|uniref:ABC transmembrane type-1 domain-containing protein n=1 Tax=Smittium megazygosporum TaxID=133381 RepID=A0A2T9Y4P1_9FUNG|nr:hypothetical protein BB560_006508 [Smittium megazygosporum]
MINAIFAILSSAVLLGQAFQFLGLIPKAAVLSTKILEVFNSIRKVNVRDSSGDSPSGNTGVVSAQSVDFNYPPRPDIKVLDQVLLEAKPGQTIPLVGCFRSDRESEVVAQKALGAASEGTTTITIAHRLSTIQRSGCIYAFDTEIIAEQETHQTLTVMK